MTPESAFARRLAAQEIEHELERLEQLQVELADAPRDDDTFTLRARGSVLHDFGLPMNAYKSPRPCPTATSTPAGSGVKSSPGLMKRFRSRPYCLS